MRRLLATLTVLLATVFAGGTDARAQTPEIAAFAGWGFGGGLTSPATGDGIAIEAGPVYGGTFSAAISRTWRVEALVSRQESRVEGGAPGSHINVALERYMAGIQEEKARGGVRAFGTFLIGATRFAPSGFESEFWFTLGVGLGVKTRLSDHLGLRFEARGFYTPVMSSGATVCAGGHCIFAFSGSGVFQGDVSGGMLFAF